MILDRLSIAQIYSPLHPYWTSALSFLQRPDLSTLPPGRYPIDGDNLFALVNIEQGRGRDAARLEVHRKYIDIQYLVEGREVIGWSPLESCSATGLGFDLDRDIEFFTSRPETWLILSPGDLAVFWPTDAHAPLAGEGEVRKVVVKLKA